MLDVFDAALAFIHDNRFAWQDDARTKATEGIYWQITNTARVALNSTRTHDRRQKFCEESASWPDGVSGDVGQYVDAFIDTGSPPALPSKDWSWVRPETDPYTRTTVELRHHGIHERHQRRERAQQRKTDRKGVDQ